MKQQRNGNVGLVLGALLLAASTGWSMDKTELAAAIKATAAVEADLISRYPAVITEEPVAFLAPWTAWKVQVQHPHHPIFLHVVHRPGANGWVISRGAHEYDLFRDEAKPEVKDEAAALEAAKWYLRAIGGKKLWLIEKLEDMPWLPAVAGDDARAQALSDARQRLQDKVTAPAVATVGGDFEIKLCVLVDRTLFRYVVSVSKSGRIACQTERIADDLPVVWVR